jgi:hypothetical protein
MAPGTVRASRTDHWNEFLEDLGLEQQDRCAGGDGAATVAASTFWVVPGG